MDKVEIKVYNHLYKSYLKIKEAKTTQEGVKIANTISALQKVTSNETEKEPLCFTVAKNLTDYAYALKDREWINNEINVVLEKINKLVLSNSKSNAKIIENTHNLLHKISNCTKENFNRENEISKIDNYIKENLENFYAYEKQQTKQCLSGYLNFALINNINNSIIENTEKEFNKYCVKIR